MKKAVTPMMNLGTKGDEGGRNKGVSSREGSKICCAQDQVTLGRHNPLQNAALPRVEQPVFAVQIDLQQRHGLNISNGRWVDGYQSTRGSLTASHRQSASRQSTHPFIKQKKKAMSMITTGVGLPLRCRGKMHVLCEGHEWSVPFAASDVGHGANTP